MAPALPSCQGVGAGQAWAHPRLQLPRGLPSPWAEAGMGPNRQGAWQPAEGERWGWARQARWDLLSRDRPWPSLMVLELGSGGKEGHTQEKRLLEPGGCACRGWGWHKGRKKAVPLWPTVEVGRETLGVMPTLVPGAQPALAATAHRTCSRTSSPTWGLLFGHVLLLPRCTVRPL